MKNKIKKLMFAFIFATTILGLVGCGVSDVVVANGVKSVKSGTSFEGITYTLNEEIDSEYVSEIWPENDGRAMDAYTITITGDLEQSDFDDTFEYETVEVEFILTADAVSMYYAGETYDLADYDEPGIAINVLKYGTDSETIEKTKVNYGTSYVAFLDSEENIVYECYIITDFAGLTLV